MVLFEEITNSANITGTQSSAQVRVENYGSLLNRAISTQCVLGGSQAVLIRASANIFGVRSLTMVKLSELVRSPIYSIRTAMTKHFIEIFNAANSKVSGTLSMNNSLAVRSLMRVKNVSRTTMSATVRNMGNSHSKNTLIHGSAIFLDRVGAIDSLHGDLHVDIKNPGKIHARGIVSMRNRAQCSDNVVKLRGQTKDTRLSVNLRAYCDVRALKLDLKGSFNVIASVVRTFMFVRRVIRAEVTNSANSVASGQVNITGGNSIRDIVTVRAPDVAISVVLKSYGFANIICGSQESSARIFNGHLVQNILAIPRNTHAKVKAAVVLTDFGNMHVTKKGNPTLVRRICTDIESTCDIEVRVTDTGELRSCN